MDGIVLGLAILVLSTVVDFYLGLVSKNDDPLAISLRMQLVSIPVLLIAFLVLMPVDIEWIDIAYGALAGLIQIFALRLFLRALANGVMGIVSSLSSLVHAIVPITWALAFNNEHFTVYAAIGSVLALISLPILNQAPADPYELLKHRASVRDAVSSGFLFGLVFVCIGSASQESPLVPVTAMRISMAIVAFVLLAYLGKSIHLSAKSAKVALIAGFGSVAVWTLFGYAAQLHVAATATVIGVFEPLAIAYLAYVVLKQRLERVQLFGVVLLVASLVLLAL